MSEKWTRRSALALLGSGGFTTTIADRETDVETKPDDQALLRVVGEDNGTRVLPGNTFGTPFTIVFTNQTNATIPGGDFDLTLDPLGTGLDDLELEDDDGDVALTGTAGEFTNDEDFSVGDEARLRVENFRCETEFDLNVSARNNAGTAIELTRNTAVAAPDSPVPTPAVADFWWPVDEGVGDDVEDREGGQDGTRIGPEWVCGRWVGGWALEADEESDSVETTNWGDAGFDLNDEFAIAYTIDSDDDSDNATVMAARESAAGSAEGFNVTFSHDWAGLSRGAGFQICDGSNDAVVTTDNGEAVEDPPHRFVINKRNTSDDDNPHDPAEWQIYRDGVELDTSIPIDDGLDAELPDLVTETRFFDWEGVDRGLEGVLDDVIVFSRPLTESEIQSDFTRQPWADIVEFAVTIDATNSPVVEGETLTVDVTVENRDDTEDTQTIVLFYDDDGDGNADTIADSTEVTLEGGEVEEITLEWETESGDAGEDIVIEVSSDSDRDDDTVTVLVQPTLDSDASEIEPTLVPAGAERDYEATVELENLDSVTGDTNEVTVTLMDYDNQNGDVSETQTFDADSIGTDQTLTVTVGSGEFEGRTAPEAGEYDVEVDVTFDDSELQPIEGELIGEITVNEDSMADVLLIGDVETWPGDNSDTQLRTFMNPHLNG